MRRRLVASLAMLIPISAFAQGMPFDMSPERPPIEEPLPGEQAPEPDEALDPEPEPENDEAASSEELETRNGAPEDAGNGSDEPRPSRRYLLPEPAMRFAGETDRRSWAMTEDQAASANRLDLGYRNAVVVAPEASRLFVTVNGVTILDHAVQAAEQVRQVSIELQPGVFQTGRNEIAVHAVHRHRTDCSIQSTYELWTELDAARTFLTYGTQMPGASVAEDIRALGSDTEGNAEVVIVAPALARSDVGADIVRLAQTVALSANFANPKFSIMSDRVAASAEPALTVVLGTVDEVSALGLSPGQIDGPTSALMRDDAGAPVLLVTGRDRPDWLAALDQLARQVDRPAGSERAALVTEAHRTPNAPMIYSGRSIGFGELGIGSEQFAGRRYTRSFQFAIPSDFYAGSYGQARILLDAAYTAEVLPGSLINVYVNGNIATSLPIQTRRGAVLRQYPIKVTMEHFRPGANTVLLEVDLLTQADEVCAPGTPTTTTPRFALFESSSFEIPQFARIAQVPSLPAVAGTGYPYPLSADAVPLVIGRSNAANLSAAATFLSRVAMLSGRIVPVEITSSPELARERSAIFVGTPASLPAGVLEQVGVDPQAAARWAPIHAVPTLAGPGDERPVTMEEWRGQTEGSFLERGLRNFTDWLGNTFDLTTAMLRFAPEEDPPYVPDQSDALLVAQGLSPVGTGTWTVIAAPDEAGVDRGVRSLVDPQNWSRLAGHLTAYPASDEPVRVLAGGGSFIQSQPPSLANYRLIVANWLSTNILSYALALIAACLLLGIATSRLLARLGRRN
jgi:cellulose synthase operon protein B